MNSFLKISTVLFLTLMEILCAEEKQPCKASNGETGECISIIDCPILFEALANPRKEDEAYLAKYLCEGETRPKEKRMTVCCVTTLNITVDTEDDLKKLNQLSDRRYCGFQHRDDYVSNDTSIAIDEFPWLATYVVGTLPGADLGIRCGATLINERYVLTSAYCVIYEKSLSKKPEVVRLGDFHLSNKTDCVHLSAYDDTECSNYEEYGIEEKIPHPFYDLPTRLNDIALLRLDKRVTYSDYIRPICLPTAQATLAQPNEIMYATGLGNWVGTLAKKKIKTKLMAKAECQEELETIYMYTSEARRPLTVNQMCTWDTDQKDVSACIYDKGGPTMFSHNNQWHIEGILVNPWCYRVEPVINTRVERYLSWIQRNIRP